MRSKQVLKNLKKALEQDFLYNEQELSYMREQLSILEYEIYEKRYITISVYVCQAQYHALSWTLMLLLLATISLELPLWMGLAPCPSSIPQSRSLFHVE